MSHELHYTSAARGLKPGTHGFCTVAATANLAPPVAERLEGLSGYRSIFPPGHPSARLNPPVISHLKLSIIGQSFHILSRVGEAGLDYSGRGNNYAHHVAIEAGERPAGGPAWLASRRGFLEEAWSGDPRVLPRGRTAPQGDQPPAICRAWAQRFGDAGWAGAVAESFLADPNRPVYFFFEPGEDLLPLFAEAIALLPRDRRWDVSFSTYFTGQSQGLTCLWRGVVRDSPEAEQARRLPGVLILDPANPPVPASGGALVEQARTGIAPIRAPEPATRPAESRPSGTTRPGSPRGPRAPIDYSLVPDHAPAARGPVLRRTRPSRWIDRLDKVQVATWAGVAASLVFLIGAATAWYRSQPGAPENQLAANSANPRAADVSSDEPKGNEGEVDQQPRQVTRESSEPRPGPAVDDKADRARKGGETRDGGNTNTPGSPAITTVASLPPAGKNAADDATSPNDPDLPADKAASIKEGTEPKAGENSNRPTSSPVTISTTSDISRPSGPLGLQHWNIQSGDSITLKAPAKRIKLIAISQKKNVHKLEFRQEKSSHFHVKVMYKELQEGLQSSGSWQPLVAISYSEEDRKIKQEKIAFGDKTIHAYRLLGNTILDVIFEDDRHEYYLLQKPFAVSNNIIISEYLSRDFFQPRPIRIALRDNDDADFPEIEWGECFLRSIAGDREYPFKEDQSSIASRFARVKSLPGCQVKMDIDPEAQGNRGELFLGFDGWNFDEWKGIVKGWKDKPNNADGPVFMDACSRRVEELIGRRREETEINQKEVDKANKEIEDYRARKREGDKQAEKEIGPAIRRSAEPTRLLKESKASLDNLMAIKRALDIIRTHKIQLSLCIECTAIGKRFEIQLRGEEK